MKDIFIKILYLARPFYETGRIYDLPQIDWMLKKGEKICVKEKLNCDFLLPLIILHDIGYCKIDNKNPNIKDKKIKEEHMKEGAKIAKEILGDVDYDNELAKKIVYYVSVHDNWIFGDNKPYEECKEVALFNDLDFLVGIRNKEMFNLRAKSMNKKPTEMLKDLENEEKLVNRPFSCKETNEMFDKMIISRKKEFN
jgi:hypothetical protein